MIRVIFRNCMLLLVAVATLVACEQKPQTDEIRFPEAVVIECEAGDTPSISFNATAAWQLSSNAIWCNFYTPTGKLQDMSGAIGNHTIMLNISTEGLKDKTTEATITMKMGGRSATIATVRRAAERLMLNIMQRMSGIATMTNRYVKKIEGTKTRVLDTRKTTPGMRILEKMAVKIGGGENHRIGLFDMILLKDNHVDFSGGIHNAVTRAKEYCKAKGKNLKIELEVRNFDELQQALETPH